MVAAPLGPVPGPKRISVAALLNSRITRFTVRVSASRHTAYGPREAGVLDQRSAWTDRGAKIIARALRDAGMEVIYTGLHQTPEQIVETAIQEDADAVGISILSGAHMTLVPRILEGLKENGADDVLVVVGGTIPREDSDELKQLGVAEIFGPGAATSEIVEFLQGKVPVS